MGAAVQLERPDDKLRQVDAARLVRVRLRVRVRVRGRVNPNSNPKPKPNPNVTTVARGPVAGGVVVDAVQLQHVPRAQVLRLGEPADDLRVLRRDETERLARLQRVPRGVVPRGVLARQRVPRGVVARQRVPRGVVARGARGRHGAGAEVGAPS